MTSLQRSHTRINLCRVKVGLTSRATRSVLAALPRPADPFAAIHARVEQSPRLPQQRHLGRNQADQAHQGRLLAAELGKSCASVR
jgi:hypothetical protein